MTDLDERRAGIFGQQAEEYHRWRPSYPAPAVDWVLPDPARTLLDVGAGTGKCTALLAERGADVTAVELDPGMLGVLRRVLPGVRTHQGPAHVLPVPDATVDAVVVADAWHWFPQPETIAEVRRVLRPGGRLGLLWNGAVAAHGWVERLAELDPDHESKRVPPTLAGVPPAEVEATTFSWTWQISPEHVRGLLSTHSAYSLMDPELRDQCLDAAFTIVADACSRAGTPTVPWPHVTTCLRWSPADSHRPLRDG